MRAQSRLLGMLATFVVGVVALSGIAAASASAEACLKVKSGEPSTFKVRSTAGVCGGALATSGYVKVEEEAGQPVTGEAGVRCYKVVAGEPSAWKNNKCTEAESGTGKYIKIAVSPCEGTWGIAGQGSSLQKIAQQNVWIPESNCNNVYTSTSSGEGRKVWGIETAGNKPGTVPSPNTSGDTFIGTDEALNAAQLSNLDEAAGAGVKGTGQALVIPVVQAAVAVIVNPPAECKIAEITNLNLDEVWDGTILEWSGIATAKSEDAKKEACNKKITRVVRKDVSGTTFVFKTYLDQITPGELTCVTVGAKTWTTLAEPAHNLEWPESCTGHPLSAVVHATNSGGGGEVEEVLAKEGSIGYANLADARAKYNKEVGNHYHWVQVQNNGVVTTGVTYAPAGTGAEEPREKAANANCAGTSYGTLPNVSIDDNWAAVNGAHPTATNYPICTLTYDVGLAGYETTAKYGAGTKLTIGLNTANYLQWVVSKTTGKGQTEINLSHDYAPLPIGTGSVGEHAEGEAALVNSKA